MKFDIEVYKGQTIEYDDECDKFICEISIEDKWSTKKRSSLKDMRKEIDQFIKLNADFKAFQALELDKYDQRSFTIRNVESIRTDGKLIVSYKDSTSKSHYGKKEIKWLMQYDHEIVEEASRLEKIKEDAIDTYRNSMKELCKKLKPIDLTKYEHLINPE